jgi:drug/metabolite transporter (DMT)-like permease
MFRQKYLQSSKAQKAVLVAVALALSFALMGVWVRMMQDSFDSFQQTYLRILLAGLIALVIFRKKFSERLLASISTREWIVYGGRAVMGYAVGVAAFTIAIQHTSLGVVSFISCLPILGLLAWIMFREKVPRKSLLPIGVSILGLGLLTGIDVGEVRLGLGEWASIICMLGFYIGYLMSRMHDKQRSNIENTTILLLIGWIPVFIISLIRHENIIPQSVSVGAAIGLLLSAVANIVGLYAINYVFAHLKAYVAGNILLLEGVFALIIGLVLYGEAITLGIAAGGLLIIVSAVVINSTSKTAEEAPSTLLDDTSRDTV